MRINDIKKACHVTNNDLKRKHIPKRSNVHLRKYYHLIEDRLVDRFTDVLNEIHNVCENPYESDARRLHNMLFGGSDD